MVFDFMVKQSPDLEHEMRLIESKQL